MLVASDALRQALCSPTLAKLAADQETTSATTAPSPSLSSAVRDRLQSVVGGVGPALRTGLSATKDVASRALRGARGGLVGTAETVGSAMGGFGRQVLKHLWPIGILAAAGWGFGSALRSRDTSREREQAVLRRLHQA